MVESNRQWLNVHKSGNRIHGATRLLCIACQYCFPHKTMFAISFAQVLWFAQLKRKFSYVWILEFCLMTAKRTNRSVFVANEINGWPIIVGGIAFFVRWKSHEQFSIFENWIRHRWSVIFEPERELFVNKMSNFPPSHLLLSQIFLFGVDHANTAARRTHFIESVKCRFAYVDQKCSILRWNFVIVLAQRHQVENVAGLWISRGARIRIHWSGQRMACKSRLVEYHQLALFVVLRKCENDSSNDSGSILTSNGEQKLTYGINITGFAVLDE